MSKRRYRSVPLSRLDLDRLCGDAAGKRLSVGIDLAKEELYAAVTTWSNEVLTIVRFRQPEELEAFVALGLELAKVSEAVAFVMEPSGVYGDPLRQALADAGLVICRVNTNRSHAAAEVYDGVPSLHDAKCATLIAKLHIDGASEAWGLKSSAERQLSAALRVLDVYEREYRRNRDRLEGLLARHWPELPNILYLGSATLLDLLVEFGGPDAVSQRPDEARKHLRKTGGQFLAEAKVERVIATASSTVGMRLIEEERLLIQAVATEARRHQKLRNTARRRVERLTADNEDTAELRDVVGKTTAAVLVAAVGSPRRYPSAYAYVKSLGLNLKEKSSGKRKKGALHITKRGPGIARMFLYMAALRAIKEDPVAKAWYAKKVARQGGTAKNKALVAIMRKLAMAVWHVVAKGEAFDSYKLFDAKRLKVAVL